MDDFPRLGEYTNSASFEDDRDVDKMILSSRVSSPQYLLLREPGNESVVTKEHHHQAPHWTVSASPAFLWEPHHPMSPYNNSKNNDNTEWHEIEDRLAILLHNDPDGLQLFRSVHSARVRHPAVLASLAYLSSSHTASSVLATTDPTSPMYSASVERLAQFLALPAVERTAKLASLRLLLTLKSPITAGWQSEEQAVEDTLEFVLAKDNELELHEEFSALNNNDEEDQENRLSDGVRLGRQQEPLPEKMNGTLSNNNEATFPPPPSDTPKPRRSKVWDALYRTESTEGITDMAQPRHSETVLLWELRALCVHLQTQRAHQQEAIKQCADTLSEGMYHTAHALDHGLTESTRFVTHHVLEGAGRWLCDRIPASNHNSRICENDKRDSSLQPEPSTKTHVVTKTYSDLARRTSDSGRRTSEKLVHGIRDLSTRSLCHVANRLHQEKTAERLVPDDHHRSLASAVGQVGMASVGAAAIVGEAALTSTQQVAQTLASVTARVVEHKYGPSAGDCVRDASATAGNVIATIGNVTLLRAQALTTVVAKNASKLHLVGKHGEQQHDEPPPFLME